MDLLGKRIGQWEILEEIPATVQYTPRYRCRCTCGVEAEKNQSDLIAVRTGKFRSTRCIGCANRQRKSGVYAGWEKEKAIWNKMISRCHRETSSHYKDYGARGIHVCPQWKESFWAFAKDIGKVPPGFSIERKDNNAGYCPENCILIPRKDQCWNRRTTAWVTIDGETKPLGKWCTYYGISRKVYYKRRKLGMSAEQALTTPNRPIQYLQKGECWGKKNIQWLEIEGIKKPVAVWLQEIGIGRAAYNERIKSGMTPQDAVLTPHKNALGVARKTAAVVLVTVNGETKSLREWEAIYGVSSNVYFSRVRRGIPPDIAVTAPKRRIPRNYTKV